MAIGNFQDLTNQYKQNIYSITVDVSGWDKTTFQVISPTATLFIYGSLDGGMPPNMVGGNANTAANFSAIQAVNLATSTAVSSIAATGNYTVTDNTQYVRLQGGGANVYRLFQFNTKEG